MKESQLVKLNRILGMLGSDHAGERAAAALAAHRLVKDQGTSWWALLNPPRSSPRAVVVRTVYEWGIDHAGAAEARMRQLRSENERLRKELATAKRRLADRAAQERRARD
jgi:hypothetical protein